MNFYITHKYTWKQKDSFTLLPTNSGKINNSDVNGLNKSVLIWKGSMLRGSNAVLDKEEFEGTDPCYDCMSGRTLGKESSIHVHGTTWIQLHFVRGSLWFTVNITERACCARNGHLKKAIDVRLADQFYFTYRSGIPTHRGSRRTVQGYRDMIKSRTRRTYRYFGPRSP